MKEYTVEIEGVRLHLCAADTLFSPDGLDEGTRQMLRAVEWFPGAAVLDLGCGNGVVGIYAALRVGEAGVCLGDVDTAAVACARQNAEANGVGGVCIRQSDGLDAFPGQRFDMILSNPPYHADFSVPKKFIRQSFAALRVGGRLYMVTKRRDWYENRLRATFGGVRVTEAGGYFVFVAEKRADRPPRKQKPAPQLSKKLARKYAKAGK